MKYFLSLLFFISFFSLEAQTQQEEKTMPDFESIDLSKELSNMFSMIDSLPLSFGDFGNMNELFKEQFGEISQDNEMFNELLGQSMKMMQDMDMSEMQGMMESFDMSKMQGFMESFDMNEMEGLMDNFMKDFEGLDIEELFETEKMEKIMDKHAKRKKI